MVLLNDGLDRTYTVLNDQGVVLLICRDYSMARFVSDSSKGVPADQRIIVGDKNGRSKPARTLY